MNKLQKALFLLDRCYNSMSLTKSNVQEEVDLMDDISIFISDNNNEEEVTDTQRLDQLDANIYNELEELEWQLKSDSTGITTVRTFIDKNINNE